MILYTIVPPEHIYPQDFEALSGQMMMNYNGIPLLVEKEEGFSYRVVKIVSSDPNHFLRDDCCPGTRISFSPTSNSGYDIMNI